jgi:hypothetical protein
MQIFITAQTSAFFMEIIEEYYESPTSMGPLLPEENARDLEDLVGDLLKKSGSLTGRIHNEVAASVGTLVRSMNCYYSNLIEGHNTPPRDIDRALKKDYSTDKQTRALQLEATCSSSSIFYPSFLFPTG